MTLTPGQVKALLAQFAAMQASLAAIQTQLEEIRQTILKELKG